LAKPQSLVLSWRTLYERADDGPFPRSLRARNRKPSACPAEQRDELAAFHLISLAVPSSGQSSCGPQ
jgi:hypothetical protein